MDAAMVSGILTQVKDKKVTLAVDDGTATYETELPEFGIQDWVVNHLGTLLQCKIVDGVIVEAF